MNTGPNLILSPKQPGKPLFESVTISATPGITAAFQDAIQAHTKDPKTRPSIFTAFDRHFSGDCGDMDEEDTLANLDALFSGARLFSAYELPEGKIWIITDAQDDEGIRQNTVAMFPSEY